MSLIKVILVALLCVGKSPGHCSHCRCAWAEAALSAGAVSQAASWVPVPCQPCRRPCPVLKGRSWPGVAPSTARQPLVRMCWVSKLCCWRAIWLMVKQMLASCLPCCPDASLVGGGMPCARVASQLRCLMCSWLLPLTFSSRSLSPLLGQCPGVSAILSVAVETLLGDRSGSAFWAPLSTSLDSTPAFLLLSSPPVPQGVLASGLPVGIAGLLLPGAFECCLCYTFLWDLIFFLLLWVTRCQCKFLPP